MWGLDVEGDADLLLGSTALQLQATPSVVVTGMERGEKRESVRQRVEQNKQAALDNTPSSVCDDPVSTLRPLPLPPRLCASVPLCVCLRSSGSCTCTRAARCLVHRDARR